MDGSDLVSENGRDVNEVRMEETFQKVAPGHLDAVTQYGNTLDQTSTGGRFSMPSLRTTAAQN